MSTPTGPDKNDADVNPFAVGSFTFRGFAVKPDVKPQNAE
jgi:hypothetical protein